ncbi:Na+/H+ antiporter subunit C [Rheinheimera sp. UJ63]|uniref:Na+/H+ antiporter subunit C n=1 Tax=Rheinheimera sp. UJ63 TaxID=2910157 RepID=UPI001F32D848|nr:Na+/H+ antiporter subunit C [Rheinheimera sp. UJ63]MCF4009820.1 Na+/H+ antiporter subunit C [Rheinheimera sp. UJ63]
MELILATSIGILFASGIWLILRPRSFQVIIGLLLLSYAVNLFLFITGKIQVNRPAFASEAVSFIEGLYADPLPQALVLTAIVIGFATSALYLVVLLGSRGLTGTDHVDGKELEHDE